MHRPQRGVSRLHGHVGMLCQTRGSNPGGRTVERPRGGSGAIVAVTAYKLSGNTRTLYGTVLGQVARALYRAATRLWHTIRT